MQDNLPIVLAVVAVVVAVIVYFVFVYPMNHFKARAEARRGIAQKEEAQLLTEVELLTEIRDLLGRPHARGHDHRLAERRERRQQG